MTPQTKKLLWWVLFVLASVIFIIIFIKQLGTVSNALEALSHGSWYFLLVVAGIQAIGIVNRGAFYHSLYDYFGVKDSLKRLIQLSLVSNFFNLAAPSGGLSGIAVFVSEAQEQGMSRGRAIFMNIFAYFLFYAVFILVLSFGLFYLLFNHQLYRYQIISAGFVLGLVVAFVILLLVAIESASRLRKLLRLMATAVNYVAKILPGNHRPLPETTVATLTKEVSECLRSIRKNWRSLWLPVSHVLLIEALDILTLYYLFLVFRYPVYPGTLITAYAIGVLFTLVSITPSGVGFVEATMIVVLTNLTVPVELSAIVVVGYRLATFWVPFILGYFAFREYQKKKLVQIENGRQAH